ncbi:hypothetical protein K7432_003505 [Basidiobolus ranarum]|uniref:alpha-1,2-Mannosidase n=1 Tax=Basidiobolus ranarum TaxID=34480 RepID=A0ABR2WZP5_9FUNG
MSLLPTHDPQNSSKKESSHNNSSQSARVHRKIIAIEKDIAVAPAFCLNRRWSHFFRALIFIGISYILYELLLQQYEQYLFELEHDCPGLFGTSDYHEKYYSRNGKPCAKFESDIHKEISRNRQNQIQEAFLHAWNGYKLHAFGHDELTPVTNSSTDKFNGWGATIVDALDTLWIMGLTEEFDLAKEHVATLDFSDSEDVNFFETTIRYLGGLLSAYELSEDPLFLEKANELGTLLIVAFDSPTGIPYNFIDFKSGKLRNSKWSNECSILAEIGSVQLEYRRLSELTGNPTFHKKAQEVINILDKSVTSYRGLYPILIHPEDGLFRPSRVSFGAMGDSFYEYLIKQYILSGEADDQYRRMYTQSIDNLKKYMVSTTDRRTFVGELDTRSKNLFTVMDHLACFIPGMLALGSRTLNRPGDLTLAKSLAETCYSAYHISPSGVAPEKISWVPEPSDRYYRLLEPKTRAQAKEHGLYFEVSYYLLRPETVESLFVLYRVTGDRKYQVSLACVFRHCIGMY